MIQHSCGLTRTELWTSRLAKVHITTIQRLERPSNEPHGNVATLAKVQGALEAAGVEFLEAKGAHAGPGVRLSERPREKAKNPGSDSNSRSAAE